MLPHHQRILVVSAEPPARAGAMSNAFLASERTAEREQRAMSNADESSSSGMTH